MVAERECRVCVHYGFSRSDDAALFSCEKGHFEFTEWDDGHTHGQLPKQGSPGPVMPCDGDDFQLDTKSKWYKYIEKK